MENFEQLKELHYKKDKINEHIKRIESLNYLGVHNSKDFIGITEDNNGRYTFRTVIDIIGEDKMNSVIDSFRTMLKAEIIQAKHQNESEIDKFQIIKTEQCTGI